MNNFVANAIISYFWAIKKIGMKKLILGIALASLAVSCKKIQEGGNPGVLKVEAGAERWSDLEVTDKTINTKSTTTVGPVLGPEMNTTKKTSVLSGDVKKDSAAIAPAEKVEIPKVMAPLPATVPAVKK